MATQELYLKQSMGAKHENQSPNNFEAFDGVFFVNDKIGFAYSTNFEFIDYVNAIKSYPIYDE